MFKNLLNWIAKEGFGLNFDSQENNLKKELKTVHKNCDNIENGRILNKKW